MLSIFLNSLLIGYTGALMPGSLLTYTVDKSIKKGAKAGLLISLGHVILELFIVLLLLLGVGKYLQTDLAKVIIGSIGGMILGFLGFSALRDLATGRITLNFTDDTGSRFGNILFGGVVISATNPYFIVWWAGVGLGLIMESYAALGILGVVLFYFGHIMADISWYCFVSTLLSKTRTFINPKVYRIIIGILGICLIGFSIKFIYSSVIILIQ